jgi:hypothetical protein
MIDKILSLANSESVRLGESFKELLNKELCLGMTRYVCRFGTLSDGHEKITNAQRYYQAIREMWNYANSIAETKCVALEAQADLLDAKEMSVAAETESQSLRALVAVTRAERKLTSALVMIEDQMRCLDEFNKVRLELKDEIQTKYPNGIEQSEHDNWVAVAEYRAKNRSISHNQNLTHVPLDPITKAEIGLQLDAPEMTAWLSGLEKDAIQQLSGGNLSKFIAIAKQHQAKQIENSAPCETL